MRFEVMRLACGFALVSVACSAAAKNRLGEICTSQLTEPPPKVATGYGEGVDNIVDAPLRLQRRVEQLKSGKQGGVWSFEYDDWARTDRERFVIYVQPGHSDVSTASQFTHEVGHAMFYPSIDWSSRDAYIRSSCADEGAAVAENIVSKDTIKLCLGIDMPLTTADEETVTEKYRELASRPPLNYAELGYFFCERNIASGLNESYLDYYGRAFDEHAKEKH